MRTIKIKFEIEKYFQDFLIKKFADKYQFIISEEPEFVILNASSVYKCFQYDCVRILVLGENIRPDFNLFDYACGFDKIEFGDRYLYYPLYCDVRYRGETRLAMDKHIRAKDLIEKKDKFCNFIVSNGSNVGDIRENFFYALNEYSKVDSAGTFLNNMPNHWNVPRGEDIDEIGEVNKFRERYRFSLAFENSRYLGYTTEKIVRAFSGVTIPIYWGDPGIKEQFNSKAFIDILDFESFDEAIKYIKHINENSVLWQEMLQEPAFSADSQIPLIMEDSYILTFFSRIFDQSPKEALRRTNKDAGWGYHYEKRYKIGQEMLSDKKLNMIYRIQNKLKSLI